MFTATFAAYYPSLHGEFVWDDPGWTTDLKPLFADAGGLWRIWTEPRSIQQYYPLTGTSFWIDYQLWGYWTLPYHLENVLLHTAAAILFWILLRRLEVHGSWLAAAVFSLHPTMVESVGWITERKNLLSLLFFLGALLVYGRSVQWWKDPSARRNWAAYAAAFLVFVGALSAKITAFVFAPVILLLAWWKLGTIRLKRDVFPLVPFFGATVAYGIAVHWLEHNHIGARGAEWDYTTAQRLLVAGRALWFYAGNFLWPSGTCFVYPRWHLDTASFWQWVYPLAAFAIILVILLARNRLPRGVVVAVCCFLGPLLPVLGFMNVYGMRFTFVADRWVHFSTLPMAALTAAGAMQIHRESRRAFYGIAGTALSALCLLTWQHAGELRTPHTFWHSVIARNPQCWLALGELGVLKAKAGQFEEAASFFRQSIEFKPDYENARGNLGSAYLKLGRVEEAIAELRIAARIEPHIPLRQFHLGNALYLGEHLAEAAAAYRRALELQPSSYIAHEELASTLLRLGRLDEACSHYREMRKLQPGNPDPCTYLGGIHVQNGRYREGVEQFELALELDPTNKTALNNLALTLSAVPDVSMRNPARAIAVARKLDELSGGKDPTFLSTLAVACAEGLLFEDAVVAAEKAAQIASTQGHAFLATSLQQRAAAYRSRISR